MKILVTGGCGFIGSHLVRRLANQGEDILVIDNLKTGRLEFLPKVPHVRFIKDDISVNSDWIESVRMFDPDLVYHFAAVHYIPYCNHHWSETLAVNLLGTEHVLEACNKASSLKGFIFSSTSGVYSMSNSFLKENDPLDPFDIYGFTKKAAEDLLHLWAKSNRISVRITRFFNVYGPFDTNPRLISEIFHQMQDGNPKIELGNLESRRDYIYVEDIVDALLLISGETLNQSKLFDVFNIGTDQEYSVSEVVKFISEISNRSLEVVSVKSRRREIDPPHLLAESKKLRSLGWAPKIDFKEGLKRVWKSEFT